jgi:hypothetical protein
MIKSFLFTIVLAAALFSQNSYFQQDVAYEINVTLNDSTHSLDANEIVHYTNNSGDTLEYIWFHLWPNAYKNDETAFARQMLFDGYTQFYFSKEADRGFIDGLDFQSDEQSLQWEYHPEWGDVAKVTLDQPLVPGGTAVIETPFYVKLPQVYSRLGHTGNHYEITQWYPKPAVYDSDGWHQMPYLNRGEFYSEFGSFDVYITLPSNYRVMATGDMVNAEKEYAWLDSLAIEGDKLHELDKKSFKKKLKELSKASISGPESNPELKTLHFHQEKVHDFAWFADRNWIVRKGELNFEKSDRNVILWSMYLPKNAELWANSIEFLHDAGYWYSKFYLEYPYNHITAVDGDLSAGGGMEYPNITVISSGGSEDMLEFVIMHEVGHNWFYGIIGSNERDYAWIDEGLNEYTNNRYWHKKYADRGSSLIISELLQKKLGIASNISLDWISYLMYQMRAVSGDDQPLYLTSEDFDNANYGAIIYMKTAIFTFYLQHYLGEEKMDQVMQEFFARWKFKHAGPEDFRIVFEDNVGTDLSWYFDDVLNDTKVVDYSITSIGTGFILSNKGTLTLPVQVAFFDSNDDEISRSWYEGVTNKMIIPKPEGSVRAVIDPDMYLPDIDRANNVSKKTPGLNFVFDQPLQDKRNFYWFPWAFNWNEYNGWTPGLFLYGGYLPGSKYGVSFKPLWDIRNNRLVGAVKMQKRFYQTLGFRTVTISGGFEDFSGRAGGILSVSGLLRKPVDTYPNIRIDGSVITHSIDDDAVNPLFYSSGDLTIGKFAAIYTNNSNPLLKYNGQLGFSSSISGASYSKIYLQGDLRFRYGKKLWFKARGWVGNILNADDLPLQYRNYLSGGVDGDFEKSSVFNRTLDDGTGFVNLYEDQYIVEGPALHGLALIDGIPAVSTETSWGVNLTHSVPVFPITVFVDLAGATDLEKSFYDAGFSLELGPLSIHIPLFQSWDDSTTPDGTDWIKDRIRFEIDFSKYSIGLGP